MPQTKNKTAQILIAKLQKQVADLQKKLDQKQDKVVHLKISRKPYLTTLSKKDAQRILNNLPFLKKAC